MDKHASALHRDLYQAAGLHDSDLPVLPDALVRQLAADVVNTPASLSPSTESSAPAGPRAHALRTRRLRLSLSVATVMALAVTVTLTQTLGSSAPSAFADWQPVPVVFAGSAAQHEAQQCHDQYGVTGAGLSPKATRILVEQRGRVVLTVLADNTAFGTCMLLDGRGAGEGEATGQAPPTGAAVSTIVNGTTWTHDTNGALVNITVLAGQAGPRVTGITVRRDDGVQVTATVRSGLWAVWWPSAVHAADMTVTTSDGHSHHQSTAYVR